MQKTLPALFALLGLLLSSAAIRADIIDGGGAATITASAVGPGVLGTVTGPIPFYPGQLSLVGGGPGMFASMGNTLSYLPLGDPKVYARSSDLFQDADAAPGVGELTLESLFTATFTIDAGGTPIQTLRLAYAFGGLIGPAGGLARFDSTVTFTHSISGVVGGFSLSFITSTPGPISSGDIDSLVLPALGAGTLTLAGNIRLRVDDNPGDALVTELGAFIVAVPEPTTWLLLGTSLAILASVTVYHFKRKRHLLEADVPE